MNESPETTLSDYLRALRQNWALILLVTILCAGAAFALSSRQTKEYEATSSLSVSDPGEDLNLVGGGFVTGRQPLQIASTHAPQVTRAAVMREVKSKLDLDLSIDQIRELLTVEVDPNSFVVDVTARLSDPEDAAELANAVATADAKITTEEARTAYADAADRLAERIKELDNDKDNIASEAIYIERLSRLQSLSSVAEPVSVSDQAEIPTTPASPKTGRNTVAAAVFGLLLGIGLAFARQRFDRRLRDPAEAEELFQKPIVVRLRPQVFGHTGSAADDDQKKLGPLDQIDAESFRMLRENVRYLAVDQDLRTIAITSAVAEEGKSTVAACLAMANAAAGKRTLLVDCDLRKRVLATRFGLAESPGLADYLLRQAAPQDILQLVPAPTWDTANGSGAPSLVCIAAGSPPERPADILSSDRFREFIDVVAQAYDCVILDCPPLLPVADTLEVVPHVSGVLLCTRLNHTTRDQAAGARDALERLPGRPVGIVLTGDEESKKYYGGYYDYRRDPDPVAPATVGEPSPDPVAAGEADSEPAVTVERS